MKFRNSNKVMLARIEELVEKLDITLLYERGIEGTGGFCRVKESNMILVNKDLHISDKIDVIAEAILDFPLDNFYILPELREYLECLKVEKMGE